VFDDIPARTLHPNMRWVWVARGLFITVIVTAVPLAVATIVAAATETAVLWWPAVVIGTIALAWSVTWAFLAWPRWRWDVTEIALTLHRGVLTHHVTGLPFFRIQHIDVQQGPLDRALGMSQLRVHTASISAQLPGIDADEAASLRTDLLDRAARAAAEVTDGSVDAV